MAISNEAKGIAFGSFIILLFVGVLLVINSSRSRPASQETSQNAEAAAHADGAGVPAGARSVDADAPTTLEVTESGLKYRVLRKSEGPKPKANSVVTVNYHGWLDSGKVFDSSYSRGRPFTSPLTQVIAGWTEGMQLVGEGGMIELEIPPRLGYGSQGAGPSVPPNSTLHFVVELIKVR